MYWIICCVRVIFLSPTKERGSERSEAADLEQNLRLKPFRLWMLLHTGFLIRLSYGVEADNMNVPNIQRLKIISMCQSKSYNPSSREIVASTRGAGLTFGCVLLVTLSALCRYDGPVVVAKSLCRCCCCCEEKIPLLPLPSRPLPLPGRWGQRSFLFMNDAQKSEFL